MNEQFEKTAAEAAAFQKIWMETMSRMSQAAFTFSPGSPPPEVLRQIRNGVFQALAASWDEFLRSPQFLVGMRQWMEQAITFRKLSNDFMSKVRNELQAPSRGDVDTVMLTVRHMEKRLLDRIDELSAQVDELSQQSAGSSPRQSSGARAASKRTATRAAKTSAPINGKSSPS